MDYKNIRHFLLFQRMSFCNRKNGSEKMLELKGKYNTEKVYTDMIVQESIAQIILLCSQKFTKGLQIRMMPDVHAGSLLYFGK